MSAPDNDDTKTSEGSQERKPEMTEAEFNEDTAFECVAAELFVSTVRAGMDTVESSFTCQSCRKVRVSREELIAIYRYKEKKLLLWRVCNECQDCDDEELSRLEARLLWTVSPLGIAYYPFKPPWLVYRDGAYVSVPPDTVGRQH